MAQAPTDPSEIGPEALDAAIGRARNVFREWVVRLGDIKSKAEALKRMSRVGGTHE